MTYDEWLAVQRDCACRVQGVDAETLPAELDVLAALARAFADAPEVLLFSEPLLARSDRRPDIVGIHPTLGVFVVEVKGHLLDTIEGYVAGEFQLREDGRQHTIDPLKQARRAMFDLKNAAETEAGRALAVPFAHFAAFPNVRRSAWERKWRDGAPEVWFGEDLDPEFLRRALERVSGERGARAADIGFVRGALGDTSLLYDAGRAPRTAAVNTLGAYFDAVAVQERRLSHEQHQLATQDWRGGPRLVRGVAGSGKTVVLALQLARFVERHTRQGSLFSGRPLRVLVVCFNRTLVPHIEQHLATAYRQRSGGGQLPPGIVRVSHLNGLYYELSTHPNGAGLWQYLRTDIPEEERAAEYLRELRATLARDPARLDLHRYDAVYVDEGQDFLEDEYRLLAHLCAGRDREPNLYVFYDDAQNIYGRRRPTWSQLGLKLVGARSTVMKECFRNTREIVEPAFNVLLGAAADARAGTLQFADTETLVQGGVLSREGARWSVGFAERRGPAPEVFVARSRDDEARKIVERLRWLLRGQDVRAEDVLVLGARRERLRQIAEAFAREVDGVTPFLGFENDNRDKHLLVRNQVTFSTIQSAKGYDAPYVLVVSANQLQTSTEGRAMFYVACTRARERLDVFAFEGTGLVAEMVQVLAA